MKNTTLSTILCLSLTLAGPVSTVSAQERPPEPGKDRPPVSATFQDLVTGAEAYFIPLAANVVSVAGDTLFIDLGQSSGILPGMRLTVHRPGGTFLHPITREPVSRVEELVGRSEVTGVTPDGARLRLLGGSAAPGDTVRRSSAEVRALFYQTASVDWDVSEEYYFQLKDRDRFIILDTAPGDLGDLEIAVEARRQDAEIAIVLGAEKTPQGTNITQRLVWATDGAPFSSLSTPLPTDLIRDFKIGDEYFTVTGEALYQTYTLPSSPSIMAVGDFDGNGIEELAFVEGSTVVFYQPTFSLLPALEGTRIDIRKVDTPVYLDAWDFDADGRDELILTVLAPDSAKSYIYAYAHGALNLTAKADLLLKAMDGALYGQHYSYFTGPDTHVLRLGVEPAAPEKVLKGGSELPISLLGGDIILNLALMTSAEGQYQIVGIDEDGRISLRDATNMTIWTSESVYSRYRTTYSARKSIGATPFETITRTDPIHTAGSMALALFRTSYVSTSRNIRTTLETALPRDTRLMRLTFQAGEVGEEVAIKRISAPARDFAASRSKLYFLVETWRIDPMLLLRTGSIFKTRLLVYPIK
jgi:hypothetical protein